MFLSSKILDYLFLFHTIFADLYVQVESGEELSFHGSFTVLHDESYRLEAFNSSAELYKIKNTVYVKALEKAVQVRPGLRLSFMSADILAVDEYVLILW